MKRNAFSLRSVATWAAFLFGSAIALALPSLSADRALIIGIDKYPHMDPSGQLKGAVNDAMSMRKLAEERWGFVPAQIRVLTNEQATADNIRNAMSSWIVQGTSPGDRALIYFSGHGYFIEDKNGDEQDGRDEVLVAHDAKPTGQGFEGFILDDEIEEKLNTLANRSVMLITDSCHSGTIERSLMSFMKPGDAEIVMRTPIWRGEARSRSDDAKDLSNGLQTSAQEYKSLRNANPFIDVRGIDVERRGGLLVWTAVAATELAQEDASLPPASRQGVFTRAFVQGLEGAADANSDGRVTAGELLMFTRKKATDYCSRFQCRTGMTPTFQPGGESLAKNISTWGSTISGVGTTDSVDVIPIPPPGEDAVLVRLALQPSGTARLGDTLKIKIESSKPGYIILLDVRDSGKAYQLFPSVCAHKERKVRAGVPLVVPDPLYGCQFKATESGIGKILAIVTEDNVPLDRLLESTAAKGIEVEGQATEYLAKIAHALMSVWTGDMRNRPVKWGLASAEYRID